MARCRIRRWKKWRLLSPDERITKWQERASWPAKTFTPRSPSVWMLRKESVVGDRGKNGRGRLVGIFSSIIRISKSCWLLLLKGNRKTPLHHLQSPQPRENPSRGKRSVEFRDGRYFRHPIPAWPTIARAGPLCRRRLPQCRRGGHHHDDDALWQWCSRAHLRELAEPI